MPEMITMIGGGSWATALTKCIVDNGQHVTWWMRDQEQVDHISAHGHNPKYMSQIDLAKGSVDATTDLRAAIAASEKIILAVPAAFLGEVLESIPPGQLNGKWVYSAVKGIMPESLQVIADHLKEKYGFDLHDFGVICGPCHAEEVAMEKLSYLTIACIDQEKAKAMAEVIRTRYLKTTLSADIHGTEYGAILKNIYAVAAGIYHGLGYGDNFHAVLVSRAIQEMERFMDAVHPLNRDINDPAYLGDLLVTAYSQFSRNRMFGTYVGKGYSVRSAQLEMNMIAEGYYAVKGVVELNRKLEVEIPICEAVYRVCYEKIAPAIEMRLLADTLN
jgi:glycerol-3-phosphate dehydrogenase (NAD(P)+)